MGIIDDLLPITDDILGVRDTIGAVIKPIYFIVRTWSGTEPGDGTFTDLATQMLPSPGIKDFSHKFILESGGRYKQGDLILSNVSKQSYTEQDLRLEVTSPKIQKFYRLGGSDGHLYVPVSILESYLTWNVHIRKLMG